MKGVKHNSSIFFTLLASFTFTSDLNNELHFLEGKFNPSKQNEFALIPSRFTLKKVYLKKRALMAFQKMHYSAKKEGVNLYILSATRTFQDQKNIWESKFKRLRTYSVQDRVSLILKYSSMPGISRHHWGTDIDIVYDKKKSLLTNRSFEFAYGRKMYQWLRKNASKFGFCQPYLLNPKKRNPGKYSIGYQEEKWHWSYKPLASQYLKKYRKHMKKLRPKGFSGYEVAERLYKQFVFNIHPECLIAP